MKPGWYKDLPGVIVNAATVAGIVTLSTMLGNQAISGAAVGVAFGLTFLIELRKFLDLSKRR